MAGSNRLTINPGIRYEQEKMAGSIITDFQLKNNWAPRLGATYDLTGDGKTKVVRQLRHFLLAHSERPGGARAVGR